MYFEFMGDNDEEYAFKKLYIIELLIYNLLVIIL